MTPPPSTTQHFLDPIPLIIDLFHSVIFLFEFLVICDVLFVPYTQTRAGSVMFWVFPSVDVVATFICPCLCIVPGCTECLISSLSWICLFNKINDYLHLQKLTGENSCANRLKVTPCY